VGAWFLASLAAGDVAVNRAFRPPDDPKAVPGQLRTYFNHGLSIEGKIRRAVGPTDASTVPLAFAGWVESHAASTPVPELPPGGLLATFYGMSFTNDVAMKLADLDPRIRVRLLGGPAAPANHSYALYSADRGPGSSVVVLGVLGSSVAGVGTNNGMTWRFEGPAPFTYPRYHARPSGLEAEWPAIRTLDDFRSALDDPARWDEFVSGIRATDDFYNAFLFRRDPGDRSVLVRMARRAVAQRWQAARAAEVHGRSGFVEGSTAVASLRGIVAAFAADARRDGKMPVILMLQDQGFRDHLDRALGPVLRRDRIPHLSTHAICPDTDTRNFLPDGHFTAEGNRKIAEALLDLLRLEFPDRLARPADGRGKAPG